MGPAEGWRAGSVGGLSVTLFVSTLDDETNEVATVVNAEPLAHSVIWLRALNSLLSLCD
jgi:hypothetical protein